jgi:hypothetical protein
MISFDFSADRRRLSRPFGKSLSSMTTVTTTKANTVTRNITASDVQSMLINRMFFAYHFP